MELVMYFSKDYREARLKFLKAAKKAGADISEHLHPLSSDTQKLAMNTAYVGDKNAKHLIITCSGIDGIEGIVGSAVQTMWLDESFHNDLDKNVAMLHIHAINPWGYANNRRVDENGVDVNRNFVPNFANDRDVIDIGYKKIADKIVPDDWDRNNTEQLFRIYREYEKQDKLKEFRKIATSGQYTNPEGIYYGGQGHSWSMLQVLGIISSNTYNKKEFSFIDVHSGLSKVGKTRFLYCHSLNSQAENNVVNTHPIASGRICSTGFISKNVIRGNMLSFIEEMYRDKMAYGGVFEIGSQKDREATGRLHGFNVILRVAKEHSAYKDYMNKGDTYNLSKWKLHSCKLKHTVAPIDDVEWQIKSLKRARLFMNDAVRFMNSRSNGLFINQNSWISDVRRKRS